VGDRRAREIAVGPTAATRESPVMNSDLLQRLSSSDLDVRNEAIVEAAESCEAEVAEALAGLLISPDVGTPARTASAQALARMPEEAGIERLRGLLQHEESDFRVLAASGLEFHPDPETVRVLLAVLVDPVNKVRNVAERSLLAMTCVFTDESHRQVEELLDHPVPLTRSPAARLAGAAAISELAPKLARMALEDEEWLPRVWSCRALGELGDHQQNLEVLEQVATSDDKNRVRAAAVEAIGEMRAERSEEILRGIVETDSDEGVKRAAEEALEDLQRGGFDDE
jgi:HEAT repeat protein